MNRKVMANMIQYVHDTIERNGYDTIEKMIIDTISNDRDLEYRITLLRSSFSARNEITNWRSLLNDTERKIWDMGRSPFDLLVGLYDL